MFFLKESVYNVIYVYRKINNIPYTSNDSHIIHELEYKTFSCWFLRLVQEFTQLIIKKYCFDLKFISISKPMTHQWISLKNLNCWFVILMICSLRANSQELNMLITFMNSSLTLYPITEIIIIDYNQKFNNISKLDW